MKMSAWGTSKVAQQLDMKMKSNNSRTTTLFILAIAAISNVCHGQALNRALAYSNMGYVTIPHSPKLQNPAEMTVEAWTLQSEWYGLLISKSDGGSVFSDRSYELGGGVGEVGIALFLGSSVWARVGSPPGLVSTGKWTHVAATFKSSTGVICLYVNGLMAASATNDLDGRSLVGQTVRQSSQPLVFGYDYPVTIGGPGPHGNLDEVRVWSVARSASQIQANMYQRLTGAEANLEGYWKFDAGTAADSTANHLDGTFYSGATTVESDLPNPAVKQATAIAQVVNGFVVGSTITDSGSGYTNSPEVSFVGGGGSGARATSQIDANGFVIKITIVSPGSGYTNAPQVLIAPPPYPPEQAVAWAQIVNGFLVGVTLTNAGRGYAQVPHIWLIGGGGTGASASATIDTNGIITGIQIFNPGSGYTNAPQVVIEPPVFTVPAITLARGQMVVFNELQAGTSYQLQRFSEGAWANTGTTITATNSTHTVNLSGRDGCRLVPLPLPRTATATPSVVNGFLVGINVTGGGAGYTSAPSVTIQDATGAGATTSVTVLTGAVTRVQIISPGSGYSANPTVTIAPPPLVTIAGSSTPAVTLNILNLFPNIPYQLERTSDLMSFEPVGAPFLPAATTNSVSVNAGTGVSFYRVAYRR